MRKIRFLPREDNFFTLFEKSARNMVEATLILKDMVDNWEDITAKVEEITELEHKGDTITHEIMAQLNRSFITPFDREDISALAHSLDDVTDFIQAAADTMLIYKVSRPGPRATELTDIIVQVASEVEKVVPKMRQHSSELKKILTICVEINRLENMADRVYRESLAELFDDDTDIATIIKWREIYEELESATDRCEDVANVLEGVALKHA